MYTPQAYLIGLEELKVVKWHEGESVMQEWIDLAWMVWSDAKSR